MAKPIVPALPAGTPRTRRIQTSTGPIRVIEKERTWMTNIRKNYPHLWKALQNEKTVRELEFVLSRKASKKPINENDENQPPATPPVKRQYKSARKVLDELEQEAK